jgi:hypothetical protein
LSLSKDDFIGVPHGDERGGNVLDGLRHEALPFCQPYNKALGHQQQHSPDRHWGQGHEVTERRSPIDKNAMTAFLAEMLSRKAAHKPAKQFHPCLLRQLQRCCLDFFNSHRHRSSPA